MGFKIGLPSPLRGLILHSLNIAHAAGFKIVFRPLFGDLSYIRLLGGTKVYKL